MANDTELKTKIQEHEHIDFLILSRDYGFDTPSECLRFIVKRELYGAKAQQKNNRMPGSLPGRD